MLYITIISISVKYLVPEHYHTIQYLMLEVILFWVFITKKILLQSCPNCVKNRIMKANKNMHHTLTRWHHAQIIKCWMTSIYWLDFLDIINVCFVFLSFFQYRVRIILRIPLQSTLSLLVRLQISPECKDHW